MSPSESFRQALTAAAPVMLGYVVIGLPCGILSAAAGLNVAQVAMLALLYYSGAGQFMIPNMWMAGVPVASIVASISLVNTRQVLYSVSLARFAENSGRALTYLFAATVTDETFGVNNQRFTGGDWSVGRATVTNLLCQSAWSTACVVGVLIGSALHVPLSIASFAMTSIFICLLFMQKMSRDNILAAVAAAIGVVICKLVGLSGPAVVIGALAGVGVGAAAMLARDVRHP